jgi:hypothetical protein
VLATRSDEESYTKALKHVLLYRQFLNEQGAVRMSRLPQDPNEETKEGFSRPPQAL